MAKTSVNAVDAQIDEIRQAVPAAKNWEVLRTTDNEYKLYEKDDSGNLRFLVLLGQSAPEALGTLNGVVLGMKL